MPRIVVLLTVFIFTAGACANPLADEPTLQAGPSRELAETPVQLGAGSSGGSGPTSGPSVAASPSDKGSGGSSQDGGGSGSGEGATDGGSGGGPADVSGSNGPGTSVAIDDDANDHGLRAPAYADVVRLALEDRGGSVRLTLTMAGHIPQRLPDDEVQGVGIDLYRPGAQESAYQVFVDGSADGWFAYFSAPGGFKKYPGSFALGADRMVFEVPWSALRLGERFGFSAFCDWTQRATGVVNLFAEDHAPDAGRASFDR